MYGNSTESDTPLGVQIIVDLLALVTGLLLGVASLGIAIIVLVGPLFLIIPDSDRLHGFMDIVFPCCFGSSVLGLYFGGLAVAADAATHEQVLKWYRYLKATVVGTESPKPPDKSEVIFYLCRATGFATAVIAVTVWTVTEYVLGDDGFFVGFAYAFYVGLFGSVLSGLVAMRVPIYDWIVVGWLKLTHPRSLFQKRKARNRTKSHQ